MNVSHTFADGTLVTDTERGDGSAPVLKSHRLRWSRALGAWYIPHSRGRIAQRHRIDALAQGLGAAGFSVTVSIDNTPTTTMAGRERERAQRAERRHDGLTRKAERHGASAQAAYERFRAELDVIPPGQPILVGHHSERRHRAALARADRAMARSVEADRERQGAEHGARSALARQRRRRTPEFIGNRIEEREAEERDLLRKLDAAGDDTYRDDLTALLDVCRDELAHWRNEWAALEAAGMKVWGPGNFRKGDRVRYRNRWATVDRVNAKTLTVRTDVMPQIPSKVPYREVQERRAGEPPPESRNGGESMSGSLGEDSAGQLRLAL